ncbi:MAG: AAA family ATPase [Verrucomicrobiota bacterium]
MNELLDRAVILDVPDVGPATLIKNQPPDWSDIFSTTTITADELQKLPVIPREPILGEWFRKGDLGFIFAPRGVGKTWLGTLFAHAIATGGEAGPWKAPKPWRVLYVDGEMALDLTKQRHRALSPTPNENLMFLHHEVVFQRTGKVLNLTLPLVQESLLQHAVANKIEVVILDNLSCLFSGVSENEADAWEQVLPWLLQLRRHGIAVVFIAHAGRNGLMRGTSRREDAAVWILSLSEPAETSIIPGAHFVARFTKCRNTPSQDAPTLEWHFQREGADGVKVNWTVADPLLIFRGWIEEGLNTCSDLAAEMTLSKGQISKLARRAQKAGWLNIKKRQYFLVT